MLNFDSEKHLSFSTSDGRHLDLVVNLKSGLAMLREDIDGETEIVSTNIIELKTIGTFIQNLEQEREHMKALQTYPFTETM